MNKPQIVVLPDIGSGDIGQIVVAEGQNLPFEVKRAYWTFNVPPNKIRGHHAHHVLEQLIICMHGTLVMTIESSDRVRHTFVLDSPTKALYIPRMCWREIKFSSDSVLLCLASMAYEESDYIRSYYDFETLVEQSAHE